MALTLRLLDQNGRGEIGFVEVPDPENFDFPETIKVSYPNIRLIWGHYRLHSRPMATYRWFENTDPPSKL